jgi:hypothetical protein
VNDATAARSGGPPGAAPLVGRRRILQLALVLPAAAAVLGGCGARDSRDDRPDPLIALADAARADAALAAAAVAADPALGPRIDPLREARTEHAAALDAEVARFAGVPPTAVPSAAPQTAAPAVTLARVREAVARSQAGAAELVEDLPAERVGLVASVAACCATYAAVLA